MVVMMEYLMVERMAESMVVKMDACLAESLDELMVACSVDYLVV